MNSRIEQIVYASADEPIDIDQAVWFVEEYIFERSGKRVQIDLHRKPTSFGLWFPESVFLANFELLMYAFHYARGFYLGRFEIQKEEA